MSELKPCPFCGVMPHIYWEAWKDISPDAGVWKLEANHKDSCYITHINGMNTTGRSSARRLSQLVEWWNHREELFGNSEQLNDLISRQAAIDALGEEPLVWHEDDAGEVAEHNQWRRDVAAIKALPSEQPEIAENLYLCKCFITDKDGLQHEVIHTGDIRRVTGWEI